MKFRLLPDEIGVLDKIVFNHQAKSEVCLTQDERPLVDYQRWKASHIYHNNHEGSSNSIEKQGTVDIYSR